MRELKMLIFCSVEKEERKEVEKEKKIRRKKAVALKREGIITSKKMTKKKNGKSKPGKKTEERVDSLSEDMDDGCGSDDYQPPLTQVKSEDGVGIGGERRRRRRRKKEERGALSPKMDFYYYSGFGPLWGKKRGDGAVGNAENAIRVIPPSSSSSSSSSDHDKDDDRRKDEEEEEEEDVVDVIDSEWKMEGRGKKKMKKRIGRRKRVKARSLKSLL